MPTISDFEYGYDADGMIQYLADIKRECLDEAKAAVEDISGITKVLDNEWEGVARDNFKLNLLKDSKHVSEQFGNLYVVLVNEIAVLQEKMAEKDQDLIKLG